MAKLYFNVMNYDAFNYNGFLRFKNKTRIQNHHKYKFYISIL